MLRRAWPARIGVTLGAAGLPAIAAAIVAAAEIDRRLWFAMPAPLLRQAASDALVLETALAVVAAPLLAVTWLSDHLRTATGDASGIAAREVWIALKPLVVCAMVFLAVSALGAVAAWGLTAGALMAIAASHATLGASLLALLALGAWCAAAFFDELDAAACAGVIAVAAATCFVVAGPALAEAPTRLINATLLASPVVATASAASIDLVRTEPLYRLTPVAHRQFAYPEWYAACAVYLATAAGGFSSAVRSLRWRRAYRLYPSGGPS